MSTFKKFSDNALENEYKLLILYSIWCTIGSEYVVLELTVYTLFTIYFIFFSYITSVLIIYRKFTIGESNY